MIVAIPEPFKTVVTFAHPLLMLATLFLALYAGYIGWQYRKIRSTEGQRMGKDNSYHCKYCLDWYFCVANLHRLANRTEDFRKNV